MNKLFFAMALLFVGMSVNAQHLGSEYRLKKVIRLPDVRELLSIAITTMFPTPKYCTNTTNREIW